MTQPRKSFWFVIGTAAELIKIFPLIDEAERRGIPWYMIATGQSGINLWRQYNDFELSAEKAVKLMETERDLSSFAMALKWFFKAAFRSRKSLNQLLKEKFGCTPGADDFWFVHGDTLSTLLGSIYGRRLNVPIVHIEAGMRSHNIWHPFPEEISRRIVSRLAHHHMAPDDNAASNLRAEGITKNVVVTRGNTVMDALTVSLKRFQPKHVPHGAYALANIHRFENLSSVWRWNKIIDVLVDAAQRIPVHLVMMPNTIQKLADDSAARLRLEKANVKMVERLPFSQFVHLMNGARFMISDGGSNQQECFHLGMPCLILREVTESIEGVGGCCVISKFDDKVIEEFLQDPQRFRRNLPVHQLRPTDIVMQSLMK